MIITHARSLNIDEKMTIAKRSEDHKRIHCRIKQVIPAFYDGFILLFTNLLRLLSVNDFLSDQKFIFSVKK